MTHSESMQELPRRAIHELIARYELEPDLRDLFVEGPSDRRLYSWYLETSQCKHVTLFDIDTIEIPLDILMSHGLTSSNRARVIALALELDGQFSPELRYVRCIADSDFDVVLGARNCANHLWYTDYTSVDLYTCDAYLLGKVLQLGFNIPKMELDELLPSMLSVLRELFTIRASNQKLEWGMVFVPFTRSCKIRGSDIIFDRNNFIRKYLNSNGRHSEQAVFEGVCKQLQTVSLSDPRQGIHSDDYFELIGWYLNQRRNWPGYRKGCRSIMPNLTAALELHLLSREKLFAQLSAMFR